MLSFLFFFFFQAEDGIRDLTVTGVQTCALPIYERPVVLAHEATLTQVLFNLVSNALKFVAPDVRPLVRLRAEEQGQFVRSEERRVGKGVDLGGRRIIKKKKK